MLRTRREAPAGNDARGSRGRAAAVRKVRRQSLVPPRPTRASAPRPRGEAATEEGEAGGAGSTGSTGEAVCVTATAGAAARAEGDAAARRPEGPAGRLRGVAALNDRFSAQEKQPLPQEMPPGLSRPEGAGAWLRRPRGRADARAGASAAGGFGLKPVLTRHLPVLRSSRTPLDPLR